MALQFPGEWWYEPPTNSGGIPDGAIDELISLVRRIVSSVGSKKHVVERFKSIFADVEGNTTGESSNLEWALTDLRTLMDNTASNPPLFISAFWEGINSAKEMGGAVPSAEFVNRLLKKHGVPFEIDPPNLVQASITALVTGEERSPFSRETSSAITLYNLLDQLGQGGFGTVWRARRETQVGEFYFAIKILDPSPFVSNREKALARFKREVGALQQLQHRGIVPYIDAGLDNQDRPFLVMPLIEGHSLRDSPEAQTATGVVRLMAEILDALHYAHSESILHRDLKPSNILVRSSDLQPVIVDFGQAYVFEDLQSQSLTSTFVGSLGYIPSEVIADPKQRSPLHDIYSCGIITYELLAHRRPDPSNYIPLEEVQPKYRALDPVIQRAIAPATSRYPHASEFADALRSLPHEKFE